MSSFSTLRSGRRNTRVTLQPFKLIHNLFSLGLTPAGFHFLLQQLLWMPLPVASFNEAAIGLLRGSVEIPVK